jgi:ribonuclease R/exosome complex exonuclease DIS3/RRP44
MKKNILFGNFQLNQKAEVIDSWFGRTIIYSDQRFAYEEAQHIIETKSTLFQLKFH